MGQGRAKLVARNLDESDAASTDDDAGVGSQLSIAPVASSVEDLLAGLNPEQREVVLHDGGPCRVVAMAGTGKTESLSRRVARLVRNGVSPSRILTVTFTTKAAEEMQSRISKRFGVAGVRIGTWHSLCLQILKQDHTKWSTWTIEGDGPGTNPKMVLKDILGWKGMDWKGADVRALASFIGICKANLFSPDSEGAEMLARKHFGFEAQKALVAFFKFNEALNEKELLTFDDYLVFANEHIASSEEVRLSWAARWDYVLCDEVQDNSPAQERLVHALARDHRNYMGIGDVMQALYRFRGSDPMLLANFADWPDAKTIVLPRNYRSGTRILDVANKVLMAHPKIGSIEPTPMIGERGTEGQVRVICTEALDDEANEIGASIQRSVDAGTSAFSGHMVLVRTNAQTRGVEESLLARRIPYVVVGGVSFYERKEVRDLLGYLRLANGTGRADDVKRSINAPFRFLGAKFVEKVMEEAEGSNLTTIDWTDIVENAASRAGIQSRQKQSAREWTSMLLSMRTLIGAGALPHANDDAKRDAAPARLLEMVVKQTGYIDFLNKEEGSESTENSGAANVREMIRVAERFPTADELLSYIDETIRKSRQQREDKQAGGDRVTIMTVHRAKGLEQQHVYVIGLNEMILPHVRGEEDEERRIAYVAMTRARDSLTLSYVRRIATRVGIKDVLPSRFLVDTGLPLDIQGEAEVFAIEAGQA